MTSLVKKIDEKVHAATPKYAAGKKLGTFVIIPDAPGRADQLRSFAQAQALQRVNLSIGVAPAKYEIAQEAYVTVVIYHPGRPGQQTVAANFALRECSFDEEQSDAILEALTKVLPK